MWFFVSAVWRYLRSLGIIYLCLYLGIVIAGLLPVTIPGSILGMLVLFTLLATQLIPVHWVRPGGQLFIRYMALLFVPISVGIMNYTGLLSAQFGPIVLSCVVSTLMVMILVGVISQRMMQNKPLKGEEHE